MKKVTWIDNLLTIARVIVVVGAFMGVCEGYFALKDKATDNKAAIITLTLQTADIENVLHSNDLRISKLETINDLQYKRKLV